MDPVRALASRQHGIVSRAEALDLGLTRRAIDRRLASEQWERIYAGVYRLAGSPHSWRQDLMAALKWIGDDGVLSHRSVGRLLGLRGCDAEVVEVTSRAPRHPPSPRMIVHRSKFLDRPDIAQMSGFRVTAPTRTVIDLAAVLSIGDLEKALDDALARRLTAIPKLRQRLEILGGKGRPAPPLWESCWP